MPDPRIREFIDEYHKSYLIAYKVKPSITGKEAARVQAMWKYCDENSIEQLKVYEALNNYFNDSGFVKEQAHPLELFFKGIVKYMQPAKKTPEQIGLENIEKAKQIFANSKILHEEKMKVIPQSEQALLEQFGKLYPAKDYETVLRWVTAHRYTYNNSDLCKDKTSHAYQRWVSHGKLARLYFGNELVDKIKNETKPASKENRKELLKKQIKELNNI